MSLLLLGDNAGDRRVFEKLLRDGGLDRLELCWARTLEEAVEALTEERRDVAVVDLDLPDSEDLRTVRRLTEAAPEVPLVVLTGRSEAEIGPDAIEAGAQDYLHKGDVTPRTLVRTLRYADLRVRASQEIRLRERYYSALISNLSDVIAVVEPDGTVEYVSPSCHRVVGYPPDELEGSNILEKFHREDRDQVEETLEQLQATPPGRQRVVRARFRHADGEWRVLENRGRTAPPETDISGIIVVSGDITERQQTEQQMQLLATAVDTMRTGVLITGPELEPPGPQIEYANPAMTDITGYSREELIGETPRILQGPQTERSETSRLKRQLADGEPFKGETVNYRKDGTPYHLRWRVTPLRNDEGEITHFVSVQEDITEQKRTKKELQYQALHDPLTGLANRTLLSDRLKQGLAHARREADAVGLLMLDIDHFKRINDRLGHTAGDRVLTELGRRLQEAVRDVDTVARWGGDEFAIVLPKLREANDVDAIRRRINQIVREPIEASGESIKVNLSIGAVVDGEAEQRRAVQTESSEELLRFGSLALHWAKEDAPRGFQIYDPDQDVEGSSRIRREGELRGGLERGEFIPYYQPIVRLENGSMVGLEVLARWRHPERGVVSPADFIPQAEELGLIGGIEQSLVQQACPDVAEWHKRVPGERTPKIRFNISGQQFSNRDMVQALKGAVQEAGCRPEQITLEVTETSVMQVPARIKELRELGFHVSIDDFGTGYSTFTYLRDLEVDELKIDLSFVQGITDSESDAALVETMVGLGKRLGLDVIAEGIATEGQRTMLQDLGCTLGQGFLFGEPLPSEELYAEWLDDTP